MFGKKKPTPQIDKDQLELIKHAEKRIKQKKRLYIHFVIFLIGAVFLILANTTLGIGEDVKFFGIEWFVYAILIWLFIFIYHFISVFIPTPFMGKNWEDQQRNKLVAKQQQRIEELRQHYLEEEKALAKSKNYDGLVAESKKPLKKNSELTLIVAAGENDAIGKDNDLIWHLSDDLKRFKELTSGHHIIMGRKTFETFPKPLPNRTHIVITRQADYRVPDGVIVVNTLHDALDAARSDKQPFVIGGGEIYKQAMPLADKIELTRVHAEFPEADTFFPKVNSAIWEEVSNTTHSKDDNHDYPFSFITYKRR